ncbi:UNVERIFIED_CONTAM: hypothetical protein GTU68_056238 [Idotea baltica]|nr:hypothetical protein [Idotea baltica]
MNILMVCLGNICRSPLAQGILEDLIWRHQLDWKVDSAGTSSFHSGHKPDIRSRDIAAAHGINITSQRARQFKQDDFYAFDLILAMDSSNYQKILALAPDDSYKNKVELILNISTPNKNKSVPDPYYHGGFEHVYRLLSESCDKLVRTRAAARV